MDYKAKLKDAARRLASRFDNIDNVPLVLIAGSLGDPYGYVNELSDIDFTIFVTDNEYLENPNKIDLNPYELEVIGSGQGSPIVTIRNFEDKHRADIWIRDLGYEMIKKGLEEFKGEERMHIRRLDDYIQTFIESERCRDDIGIFDTATIETSNYFSRKRGEYAIEALGNMARPAAKIRHSKKISETSPIDLKEYNQNVIDVLSGMTYAMCCVKNIPRSFSSIGGKKNVVLYRALGLDRDLINSSFSTTEDVSESFSSLKEIMRPVYDHVKNEFPDILDEHCKRTVEKFLNA